MSVKVPAFSPADGAARLLGLSLRGPQGGLDEALDRLAEADGGGAPDAARRNTCLTELGDFSGAVLLECDDASLAGALQTVLERATQGLATRLAGDIGEISWVVALGAADSDPSAVRVDFSASSPLALPGGFSCRDFLLAIWMVHDRFRITAGPDAQRIPWVWGHRHAGRSFQLHPPGAAFPLRIAEATPDAPRPRLQRRRSHELIVVAADSRAALMERVNALAARIDAAPRLVDLAAECASSASGPVRAALVAADAADLSNKLALLRTALNDAKLTRYQHPRGIWANFTGAGENGGLAFIFPGQGSQYFGMLRDSARYLDSVRYWFDLLDAQNPDSPRPSETLYDPPLDPPGRTAAAERLFALAHGGQSCLVGGLALAEVLERCGASPEAVVGHSNGENAALLAAYYGLERRHQEILAGLDFIRPWFTDTDRPTTAQGCNVALTLPNPELRPQILALLAGRGYVSIDNCPAQLLVHLVPEATATVLAELAGMGVICTRLPFDQPFHTPLFEEAAAGFAAGYAEIDDKPLRCRLYSAASAAPFPADGAGRRADAAAQWSRTVRFRETTQRLHEDGIRLFVDVGPAGRLSGFVRDTLRGQPHHALACDGENGSGYAALLRTLGQLFVMGKANHLQALFAGWQALDGVAPATPPPAAANSPDAALLVHRHFALMRDFLATQTRVMEAAVVRLKSAGQPAPNGGERLSDIAQRSNHDPLTFYAPRDITWDGQTWRCRITLDLARHGFLRQHTFGRPLTRKDIGLTGLPVSPLVFSCEMCAAAALRANGGGVVKALVECRGMQWVEVAAERRELHLEARRSAPGVWQVRLCGAAGELLFSSGVEIAAAYPAAPAPQPEISAPALPLTLPLDIFNHALFHGPAFIAMRRVRYFTPAGMVAESVVAPFDDVLAEAVQPDQLATPATLLDTIGQLTALFALQTRPNVGIFPVSIDRIAFFAPPAAPGRDIVVRASCVQSGQDVKGGVDFIDAGGRLLYRASGVQQRIFDWGLTFHKILHPQVEGDILARLDEPQPGLWRATLDDLPTGLLSAGSGVWLEVAARAVLGAVERQVWRDLATAAPARRVSWLLGRIAGKSALLAWLRAQGDRDSDYADVTISNAPGGAPQAILPGGKRAALSISHCDGCAMALVGPGGEMLGVDVEPEQAFAGLAHLETQIVAPAERAILEKVGLARLWCAKEAASKAAGTGLRGRPDAWLSSAWQADAEGWRALVTAPPEDGGITYQVLVRREGKWISAVAQVGADVMLVS